MSREIIVLYRFRDSSETRNCREAIQKNKVKTAYHLCLWIYSHKVRWLADLNLQMRLIYYDKTSNSISLAHIFAFCILSSFSLSHNWTKRWVEIPVWIVTFSYAQISLGRVWMQLISYPNMGWKVWLYLEKSLLFYKRSLIQYPLAKNFITSSIEKKKGFRLIINQKKYNLTFIHLFLLSLFYIFIRFFFSLPHFFVFVLILFRTLLSLFLSYF